MARIRGSRATKASPPSSTPVPAGGVDKDAALAASARSTSEDSVAPDREERLSPSGGGRSGLDSYLDDVADRAGASIADAARDGELDDEAEPAPSAPSARAAPAATPAPTAPAAPPAPAARSLREIELELEGKLLREQLAQQRNAPPAPAAPVVETFLDRKAIEEASAAGDQARVLELLEASSRKSADYARTEAVKAMQAEVAHTQRVAAMDAMFLARHKDLAPFEKHPIMQLAVQEIQTKYGPVLASLSNEELVDIVASKARGYLGDLTKHMAPKAVPAAAPQRTTLGAGPSRARSGARAAAVAEDDTPGRAGLDDYLGWRDEKRARWGRGAS